MRHIFIHRLVSLEVKGALSDVDIPWTNACCLLVLLNSSESQVDGRPPVLTVKSDSKSYSRLLRHCVFPPKFFTATSEMWCWSGGRSRVAELSLCIVHCNVYCCIITLHNSTGSYNSSRLLCSFQCALIWICLLSASVNICVYGTVCLLYFFLSFTVLKVNFHEVDR